MKSKSELRKILKADEKAAQSAMQQIEVAKKQVAEAVKAAAEANRNIKK